jgi:DNA-binding winged helix-turn-helix (wHTH) protein/Tfp pilus assembly protein PilF/TolB-like protein
MNGKVYQFEDYLLDVSEHRILKNDEEIVLPPKVFDVLTALVQRAGHLVTYDELMREVWPDTFVEEANLRHAIHTLRKSLGNGFVETVPKKGYRFRGKVILVKTDITNLHPGQQTDFRPSKGFNSGKFVAIAASIFLIVAMGAASYYSWQNGRKSRATHLRTIAVVPFSVTGEAAEKNAEIQKALTEMVTFNIGKIRGLEVKPITNGEQHAAERPDLVSEGKRLGADEVLSGTYRVERDTTHVNIELRDVTSGETLIAKSFTVKEENYAEAEKTAALQIARQIDIRAARLRDESLIRNIELSNDARQHYLTAKQIPREYDFGRWQESTDLMKKVVDEKPGWSYAHSGYAIASALSAGNPAGCPQAEEAARKALELDNRNPEAYLALAFCHQMNWEWEKAEQNYKAALELDPDFDRALVEYGRMLGVQRRFAEAETHLKRAVELEPFVPIYQTRLCEHHYYDLKPVESLKYCDQAMSLQPGYWITKKILLRIYFYQERYADVATLTHPNLSREELLKNEETRLLLEGRIKDYWKFVLDERLRAKNKRFNPYGLSLYYANLGDAEKTLEYLEKGSEKQEYEIWQANPDPDFMFLRKDPRFIEVMRKINLHP